MRFGRVFALAAAGMLVFGAVAAASANGTLTRAPKPATPTGARVEVFATGFAFPWDLAFLPDGRILVSERRGRIRLVSKTGQKSLPLGGAPRATAIGQGGMLGLALAPDFAATGELFIAFSERRGAGYGTSIARTKLEGTGVNARLTGTRVIFRQSPSAGGGRHFGSRLVFAPDGTLFATLGDRGEREKAQDLDKHHGKVVRINRDGTVPKDNPFVGKQGVRPEIWSYGHRNQQSAALHPQTKQLWTVEHGAAGGDEINIPQAGKNYGWPVISYGTHYSGAKIGVGQKKAGMEQPVYYWDPSIAPSGMAFYAADRFPQWKGNLFVGALRGRHLVRLVLDGNKIIAEERLLTNARKRIRAMTQGPDGALYVLTDASHGQILRVTPGR